MTYRRHPSLSEWLAGIRQNGKQLGLGVWKRNRYRELVGLPFVSTDTPGAVLHGLLVTEGTPVSWNDTLRWIDGIRTAASYNANVSILTTQMRKQLTWAGWTTGDISNERLAELITAAGDAYFE